MLEIWLPITGYEGLYEVSDQGRVRSLPRVVKRPHTRDYTTKLRIIKGVPGNTHRHLKVGLIKDGVLRSYWVHRLVAEAFLPDRTGGPFVLHTNDVPNDNRVANLRWGTAKDNARDSERNGGRAAKYVPATHCARGHEWTPENTYYAPKRPNERVCRACARDRVREYQRKRKETRA